MPNNILRFGPWSTRNNYRFFPGDHPPEGEGGKLDLSGYSTTPYPVNCNVEDWASGDEWLSLTRIAKGFDYTYFYQLYEEYADPINTTRESTADMSEASVSLGFFYQATSDFEIDFSFTMANQFQYGGYGYESLYVTAEQPNLIQQGDFHTYQGSQVSGTDTISCKAGVIGVCIAFVDNFGSDYIGDTVSGKLSKTP